MNDPVTFQVSLMLTFDYANFYKNPSVSQFASNPTNVYIVRS